MTYLDWKRNILGTGTHLSKRTANSITKDAIDGEFVRASEVNNGGMDPNQSFFGTSYR